MRIGSILGGESTNSKSIVGEGGEGNFLTSFNLSFGKEELKKSWNQKPNHGDLVRERAKGELEREKRLPPSKPKRGGKKLIGCNKTLD